MLSFRTKILITYLFAFLFFIAIIFPFSKTLVNQIIAKAMEERANELIKKVQSAPTDDAMVRRLKEEKYILFFRTSIISNKRKILYDSHTTRLFGPKFTHEFVVDHPEVLEAFEKDLGLHADYSDILGIKFLYIAKAFDFHGERYVIRLAFPFDYISEITNNFTYGFIGITTLVLFFFSIMTWFVIHRLTKPIQNIIKTIEPYQTGKVEDLPEIKMSATKSEDEFTRLAHTLNSLSARIKTQISTLVQERKEKEAILQSLIEGVIAVNKDLKINYANSTAKKFLNIKKRNLIGQHYSVIENDESLDLLIQCQKKNEVLTIIYETKTEGPKSYYDIIAAPTKGIAGGAVLVIQDKTTHYRLMEMRKDFVANASHELKTPITVIRGYAETLHDNPKLPKKSLEEMTEKIVKNCGRMTRLIKDLLTLADIENLPSSKLVSCDLFEILNNNKKMLLSVYPEVKVSIKKLDKIDYTIIAEPGLLDLAFENLLSNGAKYSKGPAKIDITLKDLPEKIEVTVADNGLGIPKSDLEQIFQRFYTVDKAHSKKMGGTGLGLSIVETIVKKHFGSISIESEVGKGSKFTIQFPKEIKS